MVTAVICLIALGLVILASASQSFSVDTTIFQKQLIGLGVALVFGFAAAFIDLEYLRKNTVWIAALSVLLLVLVLVPGIGVKVKGSKRWIDLGLMRFQVSELAKVAIVLVLANYLATKQRVINTFREGFVIPVAIVLGFSGLVLIEPDFGTAFLCAVVGFSLLFLVGAPLRYLVPTLLSGGFVFLVAIILNPTRLKRITSFLDVESNRSDGAYQLWQGILAFGAGGVHGVGLGSGRQQNAFLPEAHNDFILPIIGEELGLIWTIGVLAAFAIIFVCGVLIARKAPTMYYYCVAMGCLLFIVLQAIINIGVVTGLLPTKGLSLPFISAGSSNLVIMTILVGLIVNCVRSWNQPLMFGGRS